MDNPIVTATSPVTTEPDLETLIRPIVQEVAKGLLTTSHFEETLKTLPTRSEMEAFVDRQIEAHKAAERQHNREMLDRENEVTANILRQYREDMEKHFRMLDGFSATLGGHGTQLSQLANVMSEMSGKFNTFLDTQRQRLEDVTHAQDKHDAKMDELSDSVAALNTKVSQHHITIFGDVTAQNAPPNIMQTLDEISRRLTLVPEQTMSAIDRKLAPVQGVIDYVARAQKRDERMRATASWVWEFVSSKKGAGFIAGISGSAALVIEFLKAVIH